MKCLVTGAAGFIGSHLCERLVADGHDVIGIDDLSCGRVENLESILTQPNFRFYRESIVDCPRNLLLGHQWVFHLAAKADVVPSIERPWEYHDTNVNGTVRVLCAARESQVKKFIYAASSSCYGIPSKFPTPTNAWKQPQYPYALTKFIGEEYILHFAKLYRMPCISLRLFNVYGPRARTSGSYGAVFGVFLAQLANGQPLTVIGDGEQSRDFTFVDDVVEAFIYAAISGRKRFVANIGTGRPHTVNELVSQLRLHKPDLDVVQIPDRPGEPRITQADIRSARRFLPDWRPAVSFEGGVKRLVKNHLESYRSAPVWTPEKISVATKDWFKYLGAQ